MRHPSQIDTLRGPNLLQTIIWHEESVLNCFPGGKIDESHEGSIQIDTLTGPNLLQTVISHEEFVKICFPGLLNRRIARGIPPELTR